MELYANKLFLSEAKLLAFEAVLVRVEERSNLKVGTKHVIVTDRTIFCPQGGGQPSDVGAVEDKNGRVLAKVLFTSTSENGEIELHCNIEEDQVECLSVELSSVFTETKGDNQVPISEACAGGGGGAIGKGLEGEGGARASGGGYDVVRQLLGSTVILRVDAARREMNCVLHSAGHLIDTAVCRLGLLDKNLKPGKGYHFPDNPNVEYEIAESCDLLADIDLLATRIGEIFRVLVEESLPTAIAFETKAEASATLGEELGDGYPEVVRLVTIGGHGCACGGTHVDNTSKLVNIKITKAKKKKNMLKINYIVEST